MNRLFLVIMSALLSVAIAQAQMDKDVKSCKFLGNITTGGYESADVSNCNLVYSDYWSQITCENGTKWGSVHKGWGRFEWGGPDRIYNYCKQKGLIFKFHALIWGSQYPSWIGSLSVADTKKAIIEWFDEAAKHYPDLQVIDVVNEAVYSGNNYHSGYKNTKIIEALGSLAEDRLGQKFNCTTNGYPNTNSYQWLAEAFRLARERWPNAILIYNDYNTFQWQKTQFIDLINGIKACGGPIDAAGNQAHDLNDMSGYNFKNALEEIHNKTQLPQYITEYDICKADDNTQLTRYKEQFPIMWEADYVAGVTLWGWIFGQTWVEDNGVKGASGLVKDCKRRPAFDWLISYMKTDAAKNAKSPLCPGKGGAGLSASLSLSSKTVSLGDEVKIVATAESKGGKVTHIDIFANDELLVNKWIAPYEWSFTPTKTGKVTIKIVAYDDKDNKLEKTEDILVCDEKAPYSVPMATIPGTVEAENFDRGCPGISYSDSDTEDEGDAKYRNDNTGVDVVKGNGGYAIGYTAKGEWLNYTVNIEERGTYTVQAYVSSGSNGSGFTVNCGNSNAKFSVPQGADWDTYTKIEEEMEFYDEGEQTIRITIDGAYCNIDKLVFICNSCSEGTGVENAVNFQAQSYEVYTTLGVFVGQIKVNAGEDLNSQLYDLIGHEGAFVLKNGNKSQLHIVKK